MRFFPMILLLLAACSTAPFVEPGQSEEAEAATDFEAQWRANLHRGQRRGWIQGQLRDEKAGGDRPFMEYKVRDPLLQAELRRLPHEPFDHKEPFFIVSTAIEYRGCPWGCAPMPFGRHPFGPWDVGEREVRP